MRRWIFVLSVLMLFAVPDRRSDYKKALPSVVMIECGEAQGTGVWIDSTHVLTAMHVLDGSPIIAHAPIHGGYGPGLTCVLVKSDPVLDLAVLKVESKGTPLLRGPEPEPGDELHSIGCATPFGFNSGHCRSAYQLDIPEMGFGSRVIDVSTSVNPGDSGGPLLDKSNRLVGIIVSMHAFKLNTNFAVSITEIEDFIRTIP